MNVSDAQTIFIISCLPQERSVDLAVDKDRCHGRQDLIHERCVALIALRLSAAQPMPILRPGSCNAKLVLNVK